MTGSLDHLFVNSKDSPGTYVMIINAPNINSKIGTIAFIICSIGVFPTAEAMNKFTPNGGVIKPIAKLTTIMTPKWIGSTPASTAIGNKIGVSIAKAGIVSIKAPTTNKNTLIHSKIIIGLDETDAID